MIVREKKKRVIDFILENKEYYKEYLNPNIMKKINYGYTSDVNQIYCHLGFKKIENTDYYEFYKIIKENFGITNKRIIDVACGLIPIVSYIIKLNENCYIKAADKRIIFKNYKNIPTEEIDLTKDYNIEDYDLIIGFRPCYVTENIIIQALKNNKDFCIYMCPCILKPSDNHFKGRWSKKRWYKYLESLIVNNRNYDLKIITSKYLDDNCPVFIGKYKKQ